MLEHRLLHANTKLYCYQTDDKLSAGQPALPPARGRACPPDQYLPPLGRSLGLQQAMYAWRARSMPRPSAAQPASLAIAAAAVTAAAAAAQLGAEGHH